jgi:hypothetical protein
MICILICKLIMKIKYYKSLDENDQIRVHRGIVLDWGFRRSISILLLSLVSTIKKGLQAYH